MPPITRRWSDIQFTQAVAQSRSVAQVLKHLGLNATGSNYMTVWSTVARLGVSTSHWTGQRSNFGDSHTGGFDKIPAATVLSLDRCGGRKEKVSTIRRALREIGVPEVCAKCGLPPVWQGTPLRLVVDHCDGNPLDNRPWNLRFLCPNCHTQTETFGSRNIGWRDRF